MYEGVGVSHSYVLGSQSFGLKTVAEPPRFSPHAPGGANQSCTVSKLSQLPPGKTTDEFGNALGPLTAKSGEDADRQLFTPSVRPTAHAANTAQYVVDLKTERPQKQVALQAGPISWGQTLRREIWKAFLNGCALIVQTHTRFL